MTQTNFGSNNKVTKNIVKLAQASYQLGGN